MKFHTIDEISAWEERGFLRTARVATAWRMVCSNCLAPNVRESLWPMVNAVNEARRELGLRADQRTAIELVQKWIASAMDEEEGTAKYRARNETATITGNKPMLQE